MSTDSFDRRDFLKSAAGSATALVAGVGLSDAPQSQLQGEGATEGSSAQAEIQAMKNKIAIATQMLASEGIVGSSGHVSIRIGTDRILVGPSDVSRDVVTADDVVTVDLNSKQIEGKRHAPDETEIHTGIYRARPDVTSIVHTHPTYSVVFSITGQPILPVHMHGAIFADGVPVFDSVGHVNTKELGDGLAHCVKAGEPPRRSTEDAWRSRDRWKPRRSICGGDSTGRECAGAAPGDLHGSESTTYDGSGCR